MRTHIDLIRLLSDGRFHSGEELGREIGVSRAAIWKAVVKLRAMGATIFAVRGRGYCLESRLELLQRDKIVSLLLPTVREKLQSLEVFDALDSTNSYLLREIDSDWCAPQVCIAEYQFSGKGRRGRSWESPIGANLYLSLYYPFQRGIAALGGISLATGLAVRRVVAGCGVTGVGVKWPNDLVCQGRKLGGVLIEVAGDPLTECGLVVGVGLNYQMPHSVNITQPWIDMSEIMGGELVAKHQLAASLIDELVVLVASFEEQGFEHFQQEWSEADVVSGREIELLIGDKKIVGIACGIDKHGAIQLADLVTGEVSSYHSGEVSLRLR